jgi:hypothetical protein
VYPLNRHIRDLVNKRTVTGTLEYKVRWHVEATNTPASPWVEASAIPANLIRSFEEKCALRIAQSSPK